MADHSLHTLSTEKINIGVLGGGAWGTSLALHCGRKGHNVMIWAREPEVVESINTEHENKAFFKGFQLPKCVKASADSEEVARFGELILAVIPTPFVERVMTPLKDAIRDDQVSTMWCFQVDRCTTFGLLHLTCWHSPWMQIICSCTKGILNEVRNCCTCVG